MPRRRKTPKDSEEALSSQGIPPRQAAQGRGQQVGPGQQARQQPDEGHSSPVQRVGPTGPIIPHGRGQGRGQQASQQPVELQPSQVQRVNPIGQQTTLAHGRGQNAPLQVIPGDFQAAAPPGRGQQVQQAPSQVVVASPGRADMQGQAGATTPSAAGVTEQLQQMAIHGPTMPLENVLRPSTSQVPALPSSSKCIKFPRRPGFGKVGSKCIVKANHFITELSNKDLHHYDVSITPEVPSRRVSRDIVDQLVKTYQDSVLGRRLPAYDGRKSLFTAGALPFKSKDFIIKLVDEDNGTGTPRRERQFKVAIKFAAKADLYHLSEFLSGRQADAPQEALQVLDIVLRELPTRRFSPVGRSFYSPDLGSRQSLGEGLECWRGFYQSIRPTQMGPSLNIDMSSTTFFEPLPVIDFVVKLLGIDVSRKLADVDRIKIKKALRGVEIEVTHRGNQRRKYRILGLTSQTTQELIFPDDKGTTRSVVDYFQEKYNYTIRNRSLPCLQVGNQQRLNYLPMEVCKIVEGQRYSRRLSKEQTKNILKATCQRPVERERDIVQTVYHNAYGQDRYAKEFGIKINNRLAVVEARILPAPQLKYHDTGEQNSCQPTKGEWNMNGKKMVNGGAVNYWACITFSVTESVAVDFHGKLVDMCKRSGMTFHPKPAIAIQKARPDEVERALRGLLQKFKKSYPEQELDLLLAILPDNNGTLYGDLKRICETGLGLISQCVLEKCVFKANFQILANLALKINAKVGGRNTVLVDAVSGRIPLVTDQPTIIFGADVTHPHPGEDSSPSIAAVVASQDWPEVTKYAGLVCAQEHRKEIIQDLFKEGQPAGGMIRELLLSFYKNMNQRKPHRIIFYRDGVSEGQFYQVLLYELDAIRRACASLETGYQPPITFVVVQKRHHTRLFANNHRDMNSRDKSGNILPGTVVDSMICHPTEFDFYLCSHAGIQGTSRPAHYHVLWDDNNFTADGLQQLTNNLCYTYARCTRSVSIVPPAYYAHLAAFRARFYMEIESDSGSFASGMDAPGRTGINAGGASVRSLPPIKDKVKRIMFYC